MVMRVHAQAPATRNLFVTQNIPVEAIDNVIATWNSTELFVPLPEDHSDRILTTLKSCSHPFCIMAMSIDQDPFHQSRRASSSGSNAQPLAPVPNHWGATPHAVLANAMQKGEVGNSSLVFASVFSIDLRRVEDSQQVHCTKMLSASQPRLFSTWGFSSIVQCTFV